MISTGPDQRKEIDIEIGERFRRMGFASG